MSSYNPMRSILHDIVRGSKHAAVPAKVEHNPVLDGANQTEEEKQAALDSAAALEAQAVLDATAALENGAPVFDSASDPGANYSDTDVALKALAAAHEWAETSDLDEGEGYADRLVALIVGIADVDVDGELDDDEADVAEIAINVVWDYLAGKGASEEDLSSLLNDWDEEAAVRVHELLVSKLPDGDEETADEMDSFVFGDGSDESALDSAVLDATYKKKIVVRKGKKVRINKRVAGRVRLSPKQKLAVRKMLRKSHGAKATMRRAKSVRVRKQMGL